MSNRSVIPVHVSDRCLNNIQRTVLHYACYCTNYNYSRLPAPAHQICHFDHSFDPEQVAVEISEHIVTAPHVASEDLGTLVFTAEIPREEQYCREQYDSILSRVNPFGQS